MQGAGNALRAKLCRPSAGSTGATGALPAAALVRGPRHCAASLALPPPPPVSAGGRRQEAEQTGLKASLLVSQLGGFV